MKNEQLHIILGCFGLQSDGFISCAGIENRILQIDVSLYKYNELMDYLETCRLFDKPMFDYNSVRHFVSTLSDRYEQPMRPLWPQKRLELMQKFIINHRFCGLYVKLILIDPQIIIEEKEDYKGILIPGEKHIEESTHIHSLNTARGRKVS